MALPNHARTDKRPDIKMIEALPNALGFVSEAFQHK